MLKKFDLGLLNGKVFTGSTFEKISVGIINKKIKALDKINKKDCLKFIDCSNKVIIPGVIDSQVHFREPGLEHKENIYSGTKSALLGGVTTVFEMPNTSPATINKKELNKKLKIAKTTSWTNYAFFIGACKANLHLLSVLETLPGCAGIKIFMGSSTGSLLVSGDKDIETALKTCNRRVAIHSEDEPRLIERFKKFSKKSGVINHPKWRDKFSALISTQKVLRYANKYKTNAHILHISTKDEMDILKNKNKFITVEVTPQHLTLKSPDCYDSLGTLAQMNPPVRTKIHQDGLWRGIKNGTVNVIGSDHAPHTLSEKNQMWPLSPSGMPGVQTMLPIMLNHVNHGKIDLIKLIELISVNPAKIYNIKNKGSIKIGYDADITILDLKKKVVLKNKNMASKCKWTPFNNMKITGFPHATIINGSIKMINGKIFGEPNGEVVKFQ